MNAKRLREHKPDAKLNKATEANSKPNLFGRPLDIAQALAGSAPVLRHVLPGLLEGTVGLVTASGGTGKTMLLTQLAVALATDTPVCGGLFDEEAGGVSRVRGARKVVLVAAEEPSAVMTLRLRTAVTPLLPVQSSLLGREKTHALWEQLRGNLRIHALAGHRPKLFDANGEPTEAYAQLAMEVADAELIIVDPLRQLHDGDENSSGYMTTVMAALQALVANRPCAMLVAHHASQAATLNGYADHASASRGTTAITDAVRWQLNLSRPSPDWLRQQGCPHAAPGTLLRVDLAKSNYVQPMPGRLLVRGLGGHLTVLPARQSNATAPRPTQAPWRNKRRG